MSEIVEILGENKFAGSKNTDIRTRLVLDQTNKIQYETTLFYNINQQDQYTDEKRDCNQYRIYGKINPIINLNANIKTISNRKKINFDKNIFDFNLKNWSVVILKPKRIITDFDLQNNPIYSKGLKDIKKNDDTGKSILNIQLGAGLPAKTFFDLRNRDNLGLLFPLGHNFKPGDKVYIRGDETKLNTGVYSVEFIMGNRIYINAPYRLSVSPAQSISFKSGVNTLSNNLGTKPGSRTEQVNGLTIKEGFSTNLNLDKPLLEPFLSPEYYVSKIFEKEKLEYYVKTLEVIALVDDISNCAFSRNSFSETVMNYLLNTDLKLADLFDNKGEPITELYLGIVKNGSEKNVFSDVESHFSMFIDNVGLNDGLEKITTSLIPGKKVKVGDIFYHSLCETTTEELTEVEISKLHHRFFHNNVLFNYNPFYSIKLRHRSSYIEDSDNNFGIPPYSIYSKQRQKYIWRDIFDVGVTDENGDGVNFPFMNGSYYVFTPINFFVNIERKYTNKYTLNMNDVTASETNTSDELTDVLNELNDINIEESNNDVVTDLVNTDVENKPFSNYSDFKC